MTVSKGGRFQMSDIPDLSGKVAIVTGGNGGIGYEITKGLATHGARVYMASRNEQKATDAIKQLQDEASKSSTPKKLDLHFVPIDLMHISGAKTCAEAFLAKEQQLDILVCNAGVMALGYKLTDDGIEQQFQTNHLTHFALFKQLVPVMIKTSHQTGHPSRLVNLSSFAHNFISFNPLLQFDFTSKDKINRHMGFDQIGKYMRYSQSKLAALLFAREVNERFRPDEIRACAVHPGFVASSLYKGTPLGPFAGSLFITSEQGALSALMAATSLKLEQENAWNTYYGTYGSPHRDSRESKDEKLRKDLWTISEELTGTTAGTSPPVQRQSQL